MKMTTSKNNIPCVQSLEAEFLGKIVYHNYGQIGYGVVTGIDDSNPLKPRLRVKFARHETPKHLVKYSERNERIRVLLPNSVTVSTSRHSQYNETTKIINRPNI